MYSQPSPYKAHTKVSDFHIELIFSYPNITENICCRIRLWNIPFNALSRLGIVHSCTVVWEVGESNVSQEYYVSSLRLDYSIYYDHACILYSNIYFSLLKIALYTSYKNVF